MPSCPPLLVRTLQPADLPQWLLLRQRLWPDADDADAQAWLSRDHAVVLLAEHSSDGIVGFAEVGLRPYADGCDSSPVGFLEGWYVHSSYRRSRIGTHLVKAAATWAQRKGARELASDSLLEDTAALVAHLGVGFEEVERSVKYRMRLHPAEAD